MDKLDIRPFNIHIPDIDVADLSERIKRSRWPDEYQNNNWDTGTDKTYLKALLEYWASGYDWRAQEAKLNSLTQFVARIGNNAIHFVHARSQMPGALPIIITHGWPGSFVEIIELIPMLTDPARFGGNPNDAFDVVVPSLPGFGFSSRPTQPGTSPAAIADIWAILMKGLGYQKFGAQGGDLGASISVWLARKYPELVKGLHLNMIPGSLRPARNTIEAAPLTQREKAFMEAGRIFAEREGGYSHIQRTKPQTLGYGLNDSPAGLAAWIVEKFKAWSDNDGDIESAFSRDVLLTNISIYWFTGTITSSMRLYREAVKSPLQLKEAERIKPPLGFASFPKELVVPPLEWVERFFDVAQWTDIPCGGHFAALEQPELLAKDIRAFFQSSRTVV
jgi:pimeloyl-ACP methyl ester carboxylesterase